jgi:Siphovirus Gp157
MLKLRVDELRIQIEQMLRDNPELMEDDILRADMIDGETDVVAFIRKLEGRRIEAKLRMEALAALIVQLTSRLDRYKKQENAMRSLMFRLLQAGQLRKLVLPEATLSIRPGPAHVVITNENELPDEFWRIHRAPDKIKIAGAIAEARIVPGAELSNSADALYISTR